MTAATFIKASQNFSRAATPYLPIADEQHYEEALELIEKLLEEVGESASNPLNAVIELLASAIEDYENQQPELATFAQPAEQPETGLTLLRVLMDQHQLGTADLPEIGSKSMVSRVLSGQRELSKKHIQALAKRFGVEPGLFF